MAERDGNTKDAHARRSFIRKWRLGCGFYGEQGKYTLFYKHDLYNHREHHHGLVMNVMVLPK